MTTSFVEEVLALPGFRSALISASVNTLRTELGLLIDAPEPQDVDWNFALLCASALTSYDSEHANEAVLRIAQSCLSAGLQTTDEQKVAALLLLEREGNVRAASLAQSKGLMSLARVQEAPFALRLDAGARLSQLTVETSNDTFVLNSFQKEFWNEAQEPGWLSISAPTSAGKSFIVRSWIKECLARNPKTKIVYLAPTRALIEEVSSGLREDLGSTVKLQTLPWNLRREGESESSIFIFTQERLHIHLMSNIDFKVDMVFVDEAQNIGSNSRGILMSQVISECVSRNSATQVIFASPLSANPEILVPSNVGGVAGRHITGESVTVSQNLVYVNQVYRQPKIYSLRSRYLGQEHSLGNVHLDEIPTTRQRLPHIAQALGGTGGNLIYANGAADAEFFAREIYNLLGPEADSQCSELQDLSEFIRETVHEKYLLASYVLRGVAFHYGNIPLSLKLRIEDQFKAGNIKYLACTSTLLEGVNLPCRNIFIRNPKKGPRNDMTTADFWNLAGRAGRWGTEFQGNIFCIDTDRPKVWSNVPTDRIRMPMSISAKTMLDRPQDIEAYINAGAPRTSHSDIYSQELESTLSFIAAESIRGRSIDDIPGLDISRDSTVKLDSLVRSMLSEIFVDHDVVSRHFGVSPLSMERLRQAIANTDLTTIQLVDPRSDDAQESFNLALAVIDDHLGGPFGNGKYRQLVVTLLLNWMRGVPLRVIIENKAKYLRGQGRDVNYPDLIRKVLGQVEKIARFEAPKYLSCYSDIVKSESLRRGTEITDLMEDIRLMLELGVTRRTDMSLIANGLSRATAIHVGQLFPKSDLNESEILNLLRTHDFEVEDLPGFARKEVRRLVDQLFGGEPPEDQPAQ